MTHYVGRIEARDGRPKVFIPLTYGALGGVHGWHKRRPANPLPLYGLNRLAAFPDAEMILCEGEKAADAAQSLFPDRPCLSWYGGTGSVDYADLAPLRGRRVVVWPDADDAGHKAAAKLSAKIPFARVLRVDDLPEKFDAADLTTDDPGTWLSDRLHPGVDAAKPFPIWVDSNDPGYTPNSAERPAPELPVIRIAAGKVDALCDAAEAALLAAGADVFQRGGRLVRPGTERVPASDDRTTVVAGMYETTEPALIEELTRVAHWQKYDARRNNYVVVDPPALVARVLAARRGRWKLRSVAGVISCPTLRPDGSILSKPGYDPATRLYYCPDPSLILPPIPDKPTQNDALAAINLLNSLLVDYKFVDDISRAVTLSCFISGVARGAMPVVPVHGWTAPTPGSGKSYVADIMSAIVCGRLCPVSGTGQTEEELEKRLGASLLAGHQIISLDNVSTALTGDVLCQVAERPTVRIRILGKSLQPECEFKGLLLVNGNNLVIAADMTRRVLLASLDTGLERPEERPYSADPVRLVLAERGRYIAAALTIVRAYIAAGNPNMCSRLASYEAWSDFVRSAIVWLDYSDPVASLEAVRANDPVLSTLRAIVNTWYEAFGLAEKTAGDVIAALNARLYEPLDPDHPETALQAALMPVASVRDRIDATRLGKWLSRHKGRPVDGKRFVGVNRPGAPVLWRVEVSI